MGKNKLKPKIVVILGPTAMGKSTLAVEIANKFNGEIISADSRQVYRRLNIGTGKITDEEMAGVPHHLLNVVDPEKQFSVVEYMEQARHVIETIAHRGKIPIIVGGTGFYISALLGNETIPNAPENKKLRAKLGGKTVLELFQILQQVDPKRARSMNESDRQNPRRITRAIEIARYHKPRNYKVKPCSNRRPYKSLIIGIHLQPAELRKKIHSRLLKRMKTGMVKEAEHLHKNGLSWKRMEELGLEYRYLARYLRGQLTKNEMVQKLETEIWRYAKRQITWFKRDKTIRWFKPSEQKMVIATIKTFIGK